MPVVCDRIYECEGWEENYDNIKNEIITPFKVCPWCRRELNWEKWERLGGEWKIEEK